MTEAPSHRAARVVALLALLWLAPAGSAVPPALDLRPADWPAGIEGLGETDPLPAAVQEAAQRLSFERNLGQWDARALYRAHVQGYDAFLGAGELATVFSDHANATEAGVDHVAVVMRFVDARLDCEVEGEGLLQQRSNYFIGSDPEAWVTDVPHVQRVTYRGLYPGIDLAYHAAADGGLKYDFIVAPGASPLAIRLAFDGVRGVAIDGGGSLVLDAGFAKLRHAAPETFQELGGQIAPVDSAYVVRPDGTVGIALGPYDPAATLVIDPLVYSTFLGGSGQDSMKAIAVTPSDHHAYVTGETPSTNYPTTAGAYRTTAPGNYDAFVTHLGSLGTGAVYSTYLGGSETFDSGNAIAVNPSTGEAYIAGHSGSSNFPLTPGAYQTTRGVDGVAAFVTKLNAAGNGLSYSTFLSGNDFEAAEAIAVQPSTGNAYVAGHTKSTNFPVTSGAAQAVLAGGREGFVTKLNPTGTGVVYSTYLGSLSDDYARGIKVDSSGAAYVAGQTFSTLFPTTLGAYDVTFGGGSDAFVTKVNPTGTAWSYSTLLGGSGTDNAYSVALDDGGNAYVAGNAGTGFPTTLGAFQTAYGGGGDAFVAKVNPAGSALAYSTYLGGSGSDTAYGIDVDPYDYEPYVAGSTASANFPVFAAYKPTLGGAGDAFVTRLSSAGNTILYSTYFGGSGDSSEKAVSLALANHNALIAGQTYSTGGVPATSGAYRTTGGGVMDGFAAKFSDPHRPWPPESLAAACGTPNGVRLTWTAPFNGGAVIKEYRIYRDPDGNGFYTQVATSASTSYTDLPPYRTAAYAYRVKAYNDVGESDYSSAVSQAPCDNEAPLVSGAPKVYAWSPTVPQLSGVTWQDTYSGLKPNAVYSVGTSPGGFNVVGTTAVPSQPDTGDTDPYSPSWTIPAVVQGSNYVNVVVQDMVLHTTTTNGAYVVRYDTVAPTMSVSSTPALNPALYYHLSSLTLTWSGSDATSGIDGYAYVLGTDPNAAVPTTKTVEEGTTSLAVTPWSFGTKYFRIRPVDNAGNWGAVTTYRINLDNVAPAITARQPLPGSAGNGVSAVFRVDYNDLDGGADPTQLTTVDPASVVLKIDTVDIRQTYAAACPPTGNPACRLDITSSYVEFKSPNPWTPGPHLVEISFGDTVVNPSVVSESWTFTVTAL